MNTDEHRYAQITEKIIGCAYAVSNELGCGFLENVYGNAIVHELRRQGLPAQQQVRFAVMYDGVEVGLYVADLVVEGHVLVELKAVNALDDVHSAQCINLLRTTKLEVCLLINFGKPKVEIKRFMGARTGTN
jgi:GxxExxY protein